MKRTIILTLFFYTFVKGSLINIDYLNEKYFKSDLLNDIIKCNLKTNGWNNIVIFGNFSNSLYKKLHSIPYTFVISNTNEDDYDIEDVVPYHANTILIYCYDFGHFEESLLQVMTSPYWHPHANVFVYYQTIDIKENIARIFYVLWYYRAFNIVIIQHNDIKELLITYYFTPFVSDVYDVEDKYGCWTAKKIGMPIYTFDEAFVCEKDCHNVSLNSKLRANNMGTCLGIFTHFISYRNRSIIKNLELFEDKGKNLHGYTFRAFVTEILPFMLIPEGPNNTYRLASRDGTVWSTMANVLNFTIDLSPNMRLMKKPFDFEVTIQQIFALAQRKVDLFLGPIYQFDVIVVQLDYTFAYRDSGVCFMARRADFEVLLIDVKTLIANSDIVMQFVLSFISIWFIFCLYSVRETRLINMDFFGKNFMNSVRSMLNINLINPPKRTSFRIILAIIIWSYFVINFLTQATYISFFTASKRGKEVNTFDDIIEKGYIIEGMASPDVVLPDTEERFRKINSKLSPIRDIFACVNSLSNDSHKFCLVDCSFGRYLQRNKLDHKGEQYLHLAKDRIHSYYLNMILPKHSILSDNFNKYMMTFFEAGLIKKWEQYRYNEIKDEAPVKPLGIADIQGVFYLCGGLIFVTMIIFLGEVCIGNIKQIKRLLLSLKLSTTSYLLKFKR